MKKNKKNGPKKGAEKRFQPQNAKFTGHPQYVFDENGVEYKVIGITSSPETNGVLNVRLERNPEPNNKSAAYVRPRPDKVNKGVRNEKLKGWKFSNNDKKTVLDLIKNRNNKKNT